MLPEWALMEMLKEINWWSSVSQGLCIRVDTLVHTLMWDTGFKITSHENKDGLMELIKFSERNRDSFPVYKSLLNLKIGGPNAQIQIPNLQEAYRFNAVKRRLIETLWYWWTLDIDHVMAQLQEFTWLMDQNQYYEFIRALQNK